MESVIPVPAWNLTLPLLWAAYHRWGRFCDAFILGSLLQPTDRGQGTDRPAKTRMINMSSARKLQDGSLLCIEWRRGQVMSRFSQDQKRFSEL